VTSNRYASYRAALKMLGEAHPFMLPADERAILVDCAEGLLLCRDESPDGADCSELTGRAALALARAVMEDRWANDAADRAWLVIRNCGPSGDHSPPAGGDGVTERYDVFGAATRGAGDRPHA
jgi:hypothetical protein